MNLQEAKELFRAQYMAQKVFQTFGIIEVLTPSMLTVQNGHLLLRSVDQLTGEECIDICKIVSRDQYLDIQLALHDNTYQSKPIEWHETIKPGLSFIGISFISKREFQHDAINNHVVHITNWGAITKFIKREISMDFPVMQVYQYLLRIGILLPFTYLNEDNKPITLQPAEIIKLGWAQYK